MRKFAVFDIDGTFIRWQMFHAIVHSLGKQGFLPAEAHQQIRAARMEWKIRHVTDGFKKYEDLLVTIYRQTLRDIDPQAYTRVTDEVFEEYKDQTYVYTRDLVHSLKEQGYLLFAISGSQQEVVQKLAKHHGFNAAIGATLEMMDGHFTGNIVTPIFDKQAALKKLIDAHNATLKDSIAVGDSLSDSSMLALVEHAIAFNPDKPLFEAAKKHGWKIVVERKNMVYELESKDGQYILA